jgi:hypothetical protein
VEAGTRRHDPAGADRTPAMEREPGLDRAGDGTAVRRGTGPRPPGPGWARSHVRLPTGFGGSPVLYTGKPPNPLQDPHSPLTTGVAKWIARWRKIAALSARLAPDLPTEPGFGASCTVRDRRPRTGARERPHRCPPFDPPAPTTCATGRHRRRGVHSRQRWRPLLSPQPLRRIPACVMRHASNPAPAGRFAANAGLSVRVVPNHCEGGGTWCRGTVRDGPRRTGARKPLPIDAGSSNPPGATGAGQARPRRRRVSGASSRPPRTGSAAASR